MSSGEGMPCPVVMEDPDPEQIQRLRKRGEEKLARKRARMTTVFCCRGISPLRGWALPNGALVGPACRLLRCFRYCAYRSFVLWCYGRLGIGRRFELPACVRGAIMKEFPSEGGNYVGFKVRQVQGFKIFIVLPHYYKPL
ncbi:unnamed protein product [Haemonchus placei]|uniref:P2RX7_C domain-containing protein n=1 Tax=Haemonchus placei TaxID=6290 RepID=A0A158QN54_HAEPC|nr:unnamed protein product [Haemonchus placei]